MVIFNSFLYVYQRVRYWGNQPQFQGNNKADPLKAQIQISTKESNRINHIHQKSIKILQRSPFSMFQDPNIQKSNDPAIVFQWIGLRDNFNRNASWSSWENTYGFRCSDFPQQTNPLGVSENVVYP